MIAGREKIRSCIVASLLLLFLAFPFAAAADEFRPALLEISEREGGWVDVTWKVPTMGDQVLALTPVFPDFLEQVGPGSGRQVSGAWVETRSYRSKEQKTLNGQTLSVDGLSAVPADVLVRVNLADGTEVHARSVLADIDEGDRVGLRCLDVATVAFEADSKDS